MSKEEKRRKHREYMREYRKKDPEKYRKYQREYARGFRERNRERIRIQSRDAARRFRIQIIEMMGGKCTVCGFDDMRALQIDHINGGGYKERQKLGVAQIHKKIRDNPHLIGVEYQLLCANHNQIKKYEKAEVSSYINRN